jgi:hypothetical protein
MSVYVGVCARLAPFEFNSNIMMYALFNSASTRSTVLVVMVVVIKVRGRGVVVVVVMARLW